ncbi:MAG: RNA polymerase sigma factor [Planctomycetota bacterium]|jgi:RNA polymerase sigma-70 factor (ECF subfamily)
MNNNRDYIELVTQAKLGDKPSFDKLTELVQPRLYAYVYRIILQKNLAQDIVQEALLEMIKVIAKLQKPDRFWPWLRGIAYNKIRLQYKRQYRRRTVSISNLQFEDRQKASQGGLANLMTQELRQIVFNAMQTLKPPHRAVLAMRCYENMEYSQIAKLMQRNEFSVRSLFFRAKRSLHKQLSRSGFRKEFFLTALLMFGKMTAPSEASAAQLSVTGATVDAGLAANMTGLATSTPVIITLITAGFLGVCSVTAPSWIDKPMSWAEKTTVAVKEKFTQHLTPANQPPDEKLQCWYYFPEETNGPVMTRLLKWDPQTKLSYHQFLQNDRANYFFDRTANTVYIKNHRYWQTNLTVQRLPTDSLQLRQFLTTTEEQPDQMQYVPTEGRALLVSINRNANKPQLTYNYNVLDEEYFRYSFPDGVKVVDNRDPMHKRGWTYFTITGHMAGKNVSGNGRIPFVYNTSRQFPPWLKLRVYGRMKIQDGDDGAFIYDDTGRMLTNYPSGTFFKPLTRPWMGLHTIDTVRRNAAEKSVPFETKFIPAENKAEIVLNTPQMNLIYTIDLEKDIIEKIIFSTPQTMGLYGVLNFSYLQDIDLLDDDFAEPSFDDSPMPHEKEMHDLWLLKLAEPDLK